MAKIYVLDVYRDKKEKEIEELLDSAKVLMDLCLDLENRCLDILDELKSLDYPIF